MSQNDNLNECRVQRPTSDFARFLMSLANSTNMAAVASKEKACAECGKFLYLPAALQTLCRDCRDEIYGEVEVIEQDGGHEMGSGPDGRTTCQSWRGQ